MVDKNYTTTAYSESVLATNSVLRNTYLLLTLTLLNSTVFAVLAMLTHAAPVNFLIFIVGYIGLLMVTMKLSNSAWGLLSIFAFTGFMGYTLGPIINLYLNAYVNGSELVMQALGGTTAIFAGLSIYTIVKRKDFNFLGQFLFVGSLVLLLAFIGSIFFHSSAFQLAISSGMILLSSGFILFQTSQIINGGERNYILATISLYVSLYSLFLNLLNILAAFSGRE